MNRFAFCVFVDLAVLACGFPAFAEPPPPNNQFCAASGGTGTCNSVGDSICGWVLKNKQACSGWTCNYCPGSDTVPNNYCVALEGENCNVSGQCWNRCRNSNFVTGTCASGINDSCVCSYRNNTNTSCANYQLCPCTP